MEKMVAQDGSMYVPTEMVSNYVNMCGRSESSKTTSYMILCLTRVSVFVFFFTFPRGLTIDAEHALCICATAAGLL